ncbi:unnamed protein product [Adineta ricciae]|uniref:Uncharacterized protein n=1 Tax=Adineta ricciae TaxID=249248 RepID=A0A816E8L0_ADIRI|nr:unnamed protein product [Adineta ricciae]
MSSSRQSSNNNNNNTNNHSYANQRYDRQATDRVNNQRSSQRQSVDQHGQSNYENDFYQQEYYQEDFDDNLPNEIVAELDAREHYQSNLHDDDESIFSDAVQDAFKKYQNEQEELYAQMEECWNYMAQENVDDEKLQTSMEQNQESTLNPDANEFQPSWLKPSSYEKNETASNTFPSTNQSEQQSKQD